MSGSVRPCAGRAAGGGQAACPAFRPFVPGLVGAVLGGLAIRLGWTRNRGPLLIVPPPMLVPATFHQRRGRHAGQPHDDDHLPLGWRWHPDPPRSASVSAAGSPWAGNALDVAFKAVPSTLPLDVRWPHRRLRFGAFQRALARPVGRFLCGIVVTASAICASIPWASDGATVRAWPSGSSPEWPLIAAPADSRRRVRRRRPDDARRLPSTRASRARCVCPPAGRLLIQRSPRRRWRFP